MQCMCPVHGGEHACFVMHKQTMALAVLPTTMVHTSLLLGLRGRLRSMPLHSHAIVAMSRSTAESMHVAGMHAPRSRRRACMPLSCMWHVRGVEHDGNMHAAVMHVPSSGYVFFHKCAMCRFDATRPETGRGG